MRSTKRFSNSFTKHVDYDGGAHRGPRALKGTRVCERCGAVYFKRRWILGSTPHAEILSPLAKKTICPACDQVAKGLVRGYVRLAGDFLNQHRVEIEHLLEKEAQRAAEDNPLGRIAQWDTTSPDLLVVATTTEHLAERLGRAIESAYGGAVEFDFSHGNKFARVSWRRD